MVSVGIFSVFSWPIPKENSVRTFGIVHLAGTPFSLASAPFLMDQAPLLRGVPAKIHKMELLPNFTAQKIPYIPYRIYQPASASNLPIPAKLPVNRWDTTLMFTVCHKEEAELLPPQLLPRCPVYDTILIWFLILFPVLSQPTRNKCKLNYGLWVSFAGGRGGMQ